MTLSDYGYRNLSFKLLLIFSRTIWGLFRTFQPILAVFSSGVISLRESFAEMLVIMAKGKRATPTNNPVTAPETPPRLLPKVPPITAPIEIEAARNF